MDAQSSSRKILVAPLNWGLGHASRCIPIIKALLENNFMPIIASNGNALQLLRKEFPTLPHLELPSYDISYSKNIKWNLILQLPKIWLAVKKEQKMIAQYIQHNKTIVGIISDNRFGVLNSKIPSVYITHQINVLSGFTSYFTSKIHQNIIQKFDECWIPDNEHAPFSGKLSTFKNTKINAQYIGVLSRFKKEQLPLKIDVLLLLSGPEPHRTTLEIQLKKAFKNHSQTIVLVQGKLEKMQLKWIENSITILNYALSEELERLINSSKVVLCRSGYSSVMDLAVLQKKVFFIPTKGQTEQEYLAKYLFKNLQAPFSTETNFKEEKLKEIENFSGLKSDETSINSSLFRLFHRK